MVYWTCVFGPLVILKGGDLKKRSVKIKSMDSQLYNLL